VYSKTISFLGDVARRFLMNEVDLYVAFCEALEKRASELINSGDVEQQLLADDLLALAPCIVAEPGIDLRNISNEAFENAGLTLGLLSGGLRSDSKLIKSEIRNISMQI
jgi:hypothetical protein